nr:phospholipase A1 member A-like [Onthophagus taurus]
MSVVTTFGALILSAGILLLMAAVSGQKQVKEFINQHKIQENNNTTFVIDQNGRLPVEFVLFTRNNTSPIKIYLNTTLNETGFDLSVPTKIIIHGFWSSINEEVFTLPKNAYLSKGDYNIFGLDWSVLCKSEYFSAMKGAETAGQYLTHFLEYLLENGVDNENIHLIGHSLGAHVAGIGADNIKNGKIGRITALDPAGPGFNEMPHNLKLDPGDATLVDVIHTYMRILSLSEPLGHVDFYPNGGRFQPGCPSFFDIWKISESITCNHGRAYMYFVESIMNEKAFKSQRCKSVEDAIYGRCFEDSDVYMGVEDSYSYGVYYVKTKLSPPFSLTS